MTTEERLIDLANTVKRELGPHIVGRESYRAARAILDEFDPQPLPYPGCVGEPRVYRDDNGLWQVGHTFPDGAIPNTRAGVIRAWNKLVKSVRAADA